MIAVKVDPEVPNYDAKRPFEVRTQAEQSVWTKVRHYRDAAQALRDKCLPMIEVAQVSAFVSICHHD